jgi:multiple sugar transport system permease protein
VAVLRRVKVRPAAVAYHLAGLACAAVFLLPFYWALVASLRQPGLPPARTIEWWPQPAHWDNYAQLFRVVPMGRYALNSLIVVAVAMPVTLLTAALAGFALSQLGVVWRRRLVMASVALMLIPGMAVWTFRFHVLSWLGLVDSLWALIVPAVAGGSPLFVLLFYWACWRIPSELYESARLDGAEAWTVWWQIAWPLVRPTTAAVVVLAFALYWGDFSTPVLYIFRPELYTLPIGLQLLRQMDATNLPLLMAGSVLMIAPVVVVFLVVQRLFLRDLTFGSVES